MSFILNAVRVDDNVDVFVTEINGNLSHYWASSASQWSYASQIIGEGVVGKPACIRAGNRLDVFVKTEDDRLLHLWRDDPLQVLFKTEVLAQDSASSPVATWKGSEMNVFYFDQSDVLINLKADQSTGWKYSKGQVLKSSQPSNLFVLDGKLDVYFREDSHIVHAYAGENSNDEYVKETILSDVSSRGEIWATGSGEGINLFYIDNAKQICHAVSNRETEWKYQLSATIKKTNPKNAVFSVVQFGDELDLYFIKHDKTVSHYHNGSVNNFTWTAEATLATDANQPTNISAIRLHDKSIDVFYIYKDRELKSLYTGDRTGYDWKIYKSGVSLQVIQWESINDSADKFGKGSTSITYRVDKEKMVVKKMREPNSEAITNECGFLLRLGSVEAGFFRAYLHEAGELVGFCMPYFEGQVLEELVQDKAKVYYNSPSARLNLVKAVGLKLKKIQNLSVCHGDLTPSNVIIHELSPNGTETETKATIIDFGYAFSFDEFKRFRRDMTGWHFNKPPRDPNQREFERSGINAYQLARLALLVLLRTPKEAFSKVPYSTDQEIQLLSESGYDNGLVDFLKKGLSEDLETRNSFLETIETLDQFKIDDSKINQKFLPTDI